MPRKKRPVEDVNVYMRWYVKEWLTATMGLTAEERGAYATLLALMWDNHGWLVLDHRRLAIACGVDRDQWPAVWEAIKGFFQVNEGERSFTQKRLQEERAAALAGREQRSNAGKASAEKKASERAQTPKSAESHDTGATDVVLPLPLRSPSVAPSVDAAVDVPNERGVNDPHPSSVIRQDPEKSLSLARDPATTGRGTEGDRDPGTAPTSGAPPTRVTGLDLQRWFGEARRDVLGGLPWAVPASSDGKASTYAARLTPDEVADVRPTMRLMLEHVKAGEDGWTDRRLAADPSFAFGAWMSSFSALREERHDTRPAAAKRRSPPAPPGNGRPQVVRHELPKLTP